MTRINKAEEKLARAELKRVATKLSKEMIPALEALLMNSKPGERSVLIADWLDVTTASNSVKLDGRIEVLGPVDSKFISNMATTLIGDKPALELKDILHVTNLVKNTESY